MIQDQRLELSFSPRSNKKKKKKKKREYKIGQSKMQTKKQRQIELNYS